MELEKKLSELNPIMLNCNKFSIYDYPESYTITELLCEFFTAINGCIKLCNKTIDLVGWLVNEGLSQEVAKQLDTWLKDGTLANIINETIFNELNAKVNANTKQIELNKVLSKANELQLNKMKTYRFNFGDYKQEGLSDSEVIANIIKDINNLPIVKNLSWDSISKGTIVIDLNDMNLVTNEPIGIGYAHISNMMLINGSVTASDTFNGDVLVQFGNGGHTYQNRIVNVILDGKKRINGVYLNDTLNASVKECYFIDTPKCVYSESNCHESFIFENYFIWSDYENSKGNLCINIGADAHVQNNICVGYNIGIDINSNANIITNNHFYLMGKWGILSHGTSLANNIGYNYFDGCCIKLAHGGYMSTIDNNTFISQDKYASVYLERTNPASWLQQLKMTNNTIIPYNDITPVKQLDFTINGDVVNITNGVTVNENMIGALLYNGVKTEVCQVVAVYPPSTLKVKKFRGFTNNSYSNITLGNTNIMAFNNEYDWVNIVYDSLFINQNTIENGYELTSGNINGVEKKLTDSTSTIGDNIERVFLEIPVNFNGDKIIKLNKKPKHIIVDAIVNGTIGDSRGYAKLNQDTSITNACMYVSSSNNDKYRNDSQSVILVCPDNQKMYVKVTEFGNDYIKLKVQTYSTSEYKAFIDLQIF